MNAFGLWTEVGPREGRRTLCRCACGTERLVVFADLKAGRSKNCGCVRKKTIAEAAKAANTKHGRSDKTEQWIWSDMKRRCYASHRRGFANYGGRGIKVCDRWLHGEGGASGFECFLADMGTRPSRDYTLDRIDNDADYSPENCRWATIESQSYNKRATFKLSIGGETIDLKEAERRYGISAGSIYQRIKTYGMTAEEAVTRPLKKR